MKIRSIALITQLGVAALVPLAAGCSDDDDEAGLAPPTSAVIGTWRATSMMVNGEDIIANGMILNATFDESGFYAFHVENDLSGICAPENFCDLTGLWTGNETQITLNPGEAQTTISYVTTGDTMTLTGALGGVESTIVLERF